MNKEELKELCIKMYVEEGKTLSEIAKLTNWSRTFITNLIKNDERFIKKNLTKKIKVHKRKNNNQMCIYIPTKYIEKLGISGNKNISEYVEVILDEKNKVLIIKKA